MIRINVTGLLTHPVTGQDYIHWLQQFLQTGKGGYVCLANTHMCVEGKRRPEFQTVVNNGDLVLADGRPLYWMQKIQGVKHCRQMRGMDTTHMTLGFAEQEKIKVGFYGATDAVLDKMRLVLAARYPILDVAYMHSPPFRPLSVEEDNADMDAIRAAGVRILFVGLGCPKQEQWMAAHKPSLDCLQLGVGAVFDFIAGTKREAPVWLQKLGLEWLVRLLDEPGRLWRRYLVNNILFLAFALKQLILKK